MEAMTLKDSLTQKLVGLHLAHRAMMVEDAAIVLAADREIVRGTQAAMRGEVAGDLQEGNESMIHVGDLIQQTSTKPSLSTTLGKGLLAAALLSSGAAAGLGLAGLLGPTAGDSDLNTQYELRLVPPELATTAAE